MVGPILFFASMVLFDDDHPILGMFVLLIAIFPFKVFGS